MAIFTAINGAIALSIIVALLLGAAGRLSRSGRTGLADQLRLVQALSISGTGEIFLK